MKKKLYLSILSLLFTSSFSYSQLTFNVEEIPSIEILSQKNTTNNIIKNESSNHLTRKIQNEKTIEQVESKKNLEKKEPKTEEPIVYRKYATLIEDKLEEAKIFQQNNPKNKKIYNITFFGDSHIKQGTFARTIKSKMQERFVKEKINKKVVLNNFSIGGTEFHKINYNIKNWLEKSVNSDLIIIAFGTNESMYDKIHLGLVKYRWKKQIAALKEINPNANIVIIVAGESIKYKKHKNEINIKTNSTYDVCGRPKRLDEVQKMQEDLIKELNLLSWSIKEEQENQKCIMLEWNKQGLVLNDLIHFSTKGYYYLGNKFFNDLLLNLKIK